MTSNTTVFTTIPRTAVLGGSTTVRCYGLEITEITLHCIFSLLKVMKSASFTELMVKKSNKLS